MAPTAGLPGFSGQFGRREKCARKKNAGRGVGAAGIARKWEGERRGRRARHAFGGLPSGLRCRGHL